MIINNNLVFYNNLYYKKDPILYILYSSRNIFNGIEEYIDNSNISEDDKDHFNRAFLVKYIFFNIICDLCEPKVKRDRYYDNLNEFIFISLKDY